MISSTPNPAPLHVTPWQRDDRHSLALAAMMWVLLVLMIVPEGFDYRSLITPGPPSAGGSVGRFLWLGLLVTSVLVIGWRAGLAWLLARTLNPFLALFVALAVASVVWSIDPSLSVRRLVRMGTIVLVCVAFVLVAWHARRFQNVVRPLLTWMLAGSLLFGLSFPEYAIHQQASAELVGAWRGLANHKNGLGDLASIALILWFHAGLTREVRPLSALAGGAVSAACLVLSRSSTSMVASIVVMLFVLAALHGPHLLRRFVPHAVVLLMGLLMLYTLTILDLIPSLGALMAPITALTGKGTTLTGRTEIWAILADHVSLRPWFGSGYAAYWTGGPVAGTESYEFVRRMGSFYPGSAHNGYMEVVNDLGRAGLAVLLAYMASHLRQSFRMLRIDRRQGALYLGLFLQQVITNISETHWFSVLSIDFVLMTLATTALARGLMEQRLRAVYGEPLWAAGRLPMAAQRFARVQRGGA